MIDTHDAALETLKADLQNCSKSAAPDEALGLARRYLAVAGEAASREYSNALWAGTDCGRNRIASTALADAVLRHSEAAWCVMRVAIGAINGTGVHKDPVRALELLSRPFLDGNVTASYFRAQAHAQLGQDERRVAELRKAADGGHQAAIRELGGVVS